MKTISNSDYALIVDKLPVLLRLVRASSRNLPVQTINDVRRLDLLHRKLSRSMRSKQPQTKQ